MAEQPDCPKQSLLHDFAAGLLDESANRALKDHLARCSNCAKALDSIQSNLLRNSDSGSGSTTDRTEQFAATQAHLTTTKHEPGLDESDVDIQILSPSDNGAALGRMGKYDILAIQGQGGMGVVFKAFDEQLRRPVAIKVLNRSLSSSPTARRRFIREARAAAAINHPNVVTIHAVEEHRGMPFLVMEFITGGSLRDRLRGESRIDPIEAVRLTIQIAAGLAAAHAQGVIHRDIKPGNIMLEGGRDRVKITDFGLARAAIDNVELTSGELAVGTPSFMAPEQVEELRADARSDLFSLGCVIYAMVDGHSPFHGRHALEIARKVSEYHPPPLRESNPRIPQFLSDIVERLLKKDPEQRIQSAMEVADLLNRHLGAINQANSDQVMLLIDRPLESRLPQRSRRPLWLGLSAASAAAAILALAFYAGRRLSHGNASDLGGRSGQPGIAQTDLTPIGDVITVSSSGKAHFQTLQEALRRAGPGMEIHVLDDHEYRGPFLIDNPDQWDGLKIVGTGATVLSAPPPQTIVQIHGTPRIEMRGFQMKVDRSQHGFEIMGPCPGLVIEDLNASRTVEGTRKGAAGNVGFIYVHDGAAGTESAPIVIRRVNVQGGTVGIVIGEQNEGNEDAPVCWVRVEECNISGANPRGGYLLILLNSVENIVATRNIFASADVGISLATPRPMQVRNLSVMNNTFFNLSQMMVLGESAIEQQGIAIQSNLILRTQGVAIGDQILDQIGSKWFAGNWWEATPDVDAGRVAKVAELVGSVPVMTTDADSADYLRPVAEKLRLHMKPDEEIPGRHGGTPHETIPQ